MLLLGDEVLLADAVVVPGAAGVGTAAAAPARTPPSALPRSARAVAIGSGPECFAAESPGASAPDLELPLALAPLVGAVSGVGVVAAVAAGAAASDWARVVEKSSPLAVVCAVVVDEEL